MKHDVTTIKQLDAFAKKTAGTLRGGDVLALSGPLGAGKTTFVQRLAKHVGVAEQITSPTFTLMHVHSVQHPTITHLVHIDAYRFKTVEEFDGIGAADYVGKPGVVTVVEWAEKVHTLLPRKQITWYTFSLKKEKRMVEVQ